MEEVGCNALLYSYAVCNFPRKPLSVVEMDQWHPVSALTWKLAFLAVFIEVHVMELPSRGTVPKLPENSQRRQISTRCMDVSGTQTVLTETSPDPRTFQPL